MKLTRLVLGLLACVVACSSQPVEPEAPRTPVSTIAAVSLPVSVSAERAIDPSVTEHSQIAPTYWPALTSAFDGVNHLVVWSEVRGGFPRVLAVRMNESGSLVDKTPIVIAAEPLFSLWGALHELKVVHASGGYLVTWSTQGSARRLRAARVSDSGKVLEAPFDVTTGSSFDVSTDGRDFIVASATPISTNSAFITATPVSGALSTGPLLGKPFRVGKVGYYLQSLQLVRTSAGYLVFLYRDEGGTSRYEAVRFDPNGTVLKTAFSVPGYSPQVSGDSIVLVGSMPNGEAATYAIDSDGAILNGPTPPPPLTGIRYVTSGPAGIFAVLTTDAPFYYCIQKYSALGVPEGPCFNVLNGDDISLRGLTVGANTLLGSLPRGFDAAPDPIRVRQINATSGATIADTTLSTCANAQTPSAIAFDGDKYLVAWVDDRSRDLPFSAGGQFSVYAARVSVDGIAETPVRISNTGLGWVSRPAIVFDGSFFIAWHERTETDTRVVGVNVPSAKENATLVPSAPIVVTSRSLVDDPEGAYSEHTPSVAADGTSRLVVWGANSRNVLAARVSRATGKVLDTPALLTDSAGRYSTVTAATHDGTQFVVAWTRDEFYGEFGGNGIVMATRLDGAAPTLVSRPSIIATLPSYGAFTALASDGKTGSLLVWSSLSFADETLDVQGRLLPSDPSLALDSAPVLSIGSANGEQSWPAVAYSDDEVGYTVAWNDLRDGTRHVYGNWIARDGRVLAGATGLLLGDPTENDDESPALASSGKGRIGLSFSRFDRREGIGNSRLHFRSLVTGKLNGQPCGATDECASRYCVAGLCCNAACTEECATCSSNPGNCGPKSHAASCGPEAAYTCDGTKLTCTAECDSTDQCVPGRTCVNHACVAPNLVEAVCLDRTKLRSREGDRACAPYACAASACLEVCASVDDCADGYVCNFENRCVTPTLANEEGGCSMAGMQPRSPFGWVLAAALLLRVRRRRSA